MILIYGNDELLKISFENQNVNRHGSSLNMEILQIFVWPNLVTKPNLTEPNLTNLKLYLTMSNLI